ncbi:hypothetical protein JW707_04070 [Candidatus Woesearchaeota archaeon]|nr:hypothetical protein [Candidatus Woesearchaeota archaeon]
MKKKAQMFRWVIISVLIVVILLILIFLPKKISDTSEKTAVRMACEKSLSINNNLKVISSKLADSLGNLMTINCQTEYKTIKEKNSDQDPSLQREVADDVLDCWNLYGDKRNLFNQDTGTYCIICKSLEITEEDHIDNLLSYIRAKKATATQTYVQAFGGEVNIPQNAGNTYDTYRFTKGSSTAVVVTFGKLAGANYLVLHQASGIGVLLYPYDSVANLNCYSFEGRQTALEFKR